MNGEKCNMGWSYDEIVTHIHTHFRGEKKCSTKSRSYVFAVPISYQSRSDYWKDRVDIYYQMVRWQFGYKKKSVRFIFYHILLLLLSFFFGEDENPFRRGRRRSSMTVCTQQRMRRTFSLSIASTTGTHTCLELCENVPNQFPQILESRFSQSRRRGCSSHCRADRWRKKTIRLNQLRKFSINFER